MALRSIDTGYRNLVLKADLFNAKPRKSVIPPELPRVIGLAATKT
jgi:hypothetical protein